MSYPVRFEADYVERRSRLTTLLRLILVIPAALLLYVYAIVAYIAVVIAWFAIVLTGRFPAGLYNFVAGFTRFLVRVSAYALLLCDPCPPLGGSADNAYPVRVHFDGPLERYSRARTFFRIILAIPIAVLRYVLGLLLEVCAVGAWFVILVIGKLPRGLFDLMALASAYTARSDAYLFLLTETYPPFEEPAADPLTRA